MDIQTLLAQLETDGDITRIMNDPFAQFGSEMVNQTYLGARFLPERPMTGTQNNIIKEEETRFRTIIAEDSGRYDPVPYRQLSESYDMQVEMGHFDIGREIDGSEYDALLRLLANARDEAAKAKLLSLVDMMLNHGLKMKKEKQRWEAFVKRQVMIEKSNGQKYNVLLDFPAGNELTSPAFFDDNSFDPFEIIFQGIMVLKALGYDEIEAVVSSYQPLYAMMKNENVRTRLGGMRIDTVANSITPVRRGVVGKSLLNEVLRGEGAPDFTEYNKGYHTESGYIPYLPKDSMTIIARTPRREEIAMADGQDMIIPSTLGYYGVGLCQGQTEVGDRVKLWYKDDKPVRIDGQAEGVGFPVLIDNKAIVNIRGCVAP